MNTFIIVGIACAAAFTACGQKKTEEKSNTAAFGGGDEYICTDAAGRFKAREIVKGVFWPGNTVSNLTVWENGSLIPSAKGRASEAYVTQSAYPVERLGKFALGRRASGMDFNGILVIYESKSSDVVAEVVDVFCDLK